jgi:hypothetical protein
LLLPFFIFDEIGKIIKVSKVNSIEKLNFKIQGLKRIKNTERKANTNPIEI